jgi:hypothetical protein
MERIGELQKVGYNVRTIVMLNSGTLTNLQGYSTKGELFSYLKAQLQ